MEEANALRRLTHALLNAQPEFKEVCNLIQECADWRLVTCGLQLALSGSYTDASVFLTRQRKIDASVKLPDITAGDIIHTMTT